MKPSPGPWQWAVIDGEDVLVDANGDPVFVGGPWMLDDPNARLIAAGPELLRSLREVVSELFHSQYGVVYCDLCERESPAHDDDCEVGKARALIARIEGTESKGEG